MSIRFSSNQVNWNPACIWTELNDELMRRKLIGVGMAVGVLDSKQTCDWDVYKTSLKFNEGLGKKFANELRLKLNWHHVDEMSLLLIKQELLTFTLKAFEWHYQSFFHRNMMQAFNSPELINSNQIESSIQRSLVELLMKSSKIIQLGSIKTFISAFIYMRLQLTC